MNPYNENVLYDFPMPYNGVGITPPDHGGGHPGKEERRDRRNDMAIIWGTLDIFFDDDAK
jgi:hypothetical protein